MFYGQHGEDIYIKTLFPQGHIGTCIEVGAYDGITHSNTYHFEQNGWNTLCIEPIQSIFEKCKIIRKNSINCGISDNDYNEKEFHIFHIANQMSAISGLVPDTRLINSFASYITNTEKCLVPVRSLNSLLDELKFPIDIDFISIDTENTELDVLKGIDFNKYNIKLLVIENNFNESFCENYLSQFGYKKINRIAVNDFFVKYEVDINKYKNLKNSAPSYKFFELQKTVESDLEKFINMLNNNENFLIVKYGDGECLNMISVNENERNCDGNNYFRPLGDDLIHSYIHFLQSKKSYICKWHCQIYDIQTALDADFGGNLENKFIFYDILVHKLPFSNNLVKFFKTIQSSNRKKIYVSNAHMINTVCPILNIKVGICIPYINCYQQKEIILNNLKQHIAENCIILFSAGMASKVLICEIDKMCPNNTYIDIGSTFDGLIRESRDYNCGQEYRNILYSTYN